MSISFEIMGIILSFAVSVIALVLGASKQKHDVVNLDADTIKKLYEAIGEAQTQNDDLKKDFDDYKISKETEFHEYKRVTRLQIDELVAENARFSRWCKALVAQLKAAGIDPLPSG